MDPSTLNEEALIEESVLFQKPAVWFKSKFSAYPGTLFITDKTIAFKRTNMGFGALFGVIGALISLKLAKGKFIFAAAISDVVSYQKHSFGKSRQLIFNTSDGESFKCSPDKQDYDDCLESITAHGIEFIDEPVE